MTGASRSLRGDIVFALALVLACALAWMVRDVLILLYVSALFAVVLTPVVEFTARLRIGRWQPFKGTAVYFLLLAMAAALTAFGFLALPPVIRDLREFARELPMRLPALTAKLKQVPYADSLNMDDISAKLQAAQQLWIKSRDADCAIAPLPAKPGSKPFTIDQYDCLASKSDERSEFLESIAQE